MLLRVIFKTSIAELREDIEAKSRRIANLDIQLTKAVDKSETLEQNLATTKIEGDRQQAEVSPTFAACHCSIIVFSVF